MLNYIINYKFLLPQNKKQLKNIRCFFLCCLQLALSYFITNFSRKFSVFINF